MQILHTDRIGYEEAAKKAAIVLRGGGILLYPTDTVYGFGVDVANPEARRRLAELKGRDAAQKFLIAVPDIDTMARIGSLNAEARRLAERFLPGPLSLELPASPDCPPALREDRKAFGIRIPDDPFCKALSAAFSEPYASTSANAHGEPTLSTVEDIVQQFGEAAAMIDLVIDDGPREGGAPSTLVSCLTDTPVILREGPLSREMLGL